MKRKQQWIWLAIAALLLAIGAWVMSRGESPESVAAHKPNFPSHMDYEDHKRFQTRQVLAAVLPLASASDAGFPMSRDPVMRFFPSDFKNEALVIEANAIRHSEIGELLVQCLFPGEDAEGLRNFRDAGFDPLKDLDRVAFYDQTIGVSGNFSKVHWDDLFHGQEPAREFGTNAKIYSLGTTPSEANTKVVGVWKNQMVLTGTSAEVQSAIDRLDGKTQLSGPPAIADEDSYGEMYGVIKPGNFDKLLKRSDNEPLINLLNETAQSINLHVNVSSDVGMVADINGSDPTKTEELRRSIGAVLAGARVKAKLEGDDDTAQLLDWATVHDSDSHKGTNFRFEFGLPHDFLVKRLQECAEKKISAHSNNKGADPKSTP